MKIILIRHGETDWNLEKKYQGHQDIELNETGRGQAHSLVKRLLGENIEAIYSSDLIRTKETAEIIADNWQLPVYFDPRLREMSFGEWEGQTFNQIYSKYPNEFQEWYSNTKTFRVPGGESVGDLLERVWPALLDISKKHCNTVLVATHGGVVRAVLYRIGGKPDELWRDGLGNGSLVQIVITEDQVRLLKCEE